MYPRILFIVDRPNWAHDFKSRNLMRLLGSEYDFRLRYQSDVTEDDLDQATLIVLYYWFQFRALQPLTPVLRRNRHKLLVGISSSFELDDERREPGLAVIRDFASGVFIHNLLLYRQYQPLLQLPTFYTPNGVDTTFYSPATTKATSPLLRIGWAGSLTNMGPGYRGYHEFIAPAAAAVERVELLTAAREDEWRGPEEMREFYRSLDVYVCASRNEGTPNPCLEAAACGVPLLTTRVGNMPELVRDGVNGFFVERDVDDIARKIRTLRDDSDLRRAMSKQIQQDIQAWDWSLRSRAYRQMFEEMLPKARAANRAASPESGSRPRNSDFRVVALMSAYNEEDIIAPCLEYLIKQGLEVYLIDNWSTDSTVELASEFLGKGLIAIEKFPQHRPPTHYVWEDILSRIEQLTEEIEADWFVFQDVDEIRTSPWQGSSLRDAIRRVDREGFNCIDHTVITFYPTDNAFSAGEDFEAYFRYFEFSDKPGQFIEIKAWKNLGRRISLSESGGHEVRFRGRRTYPFRFLLKHYPIRSQAHGEKKIFRERKPRWHAQERARGWHTHYDHIDKGHSFLRRPDELELFDASALGEMVDWTAAHMNALQSEPDKVLMLENLEQKKRRERERNKSTGPLRLLFHRLHRLIK
ncbi:MAG TPA: glycosyltransferase [Pyrinomonadaceae bacterium]|nr:glycosyltransferase [Pyrinomonadaceae bacterium]